MRSLGTNIQRAAAFGILIQDGNGPALNFDDGLWGIAHGLKFPFPAFQYFSISGFSISAFHFIRHIRASARRSASSDKLHPVIP
jgi:hypothetical protein